MTTSEALGFLATHQPMPDDCALSQDLIVEYEKVRKQLLSDPDPRAIPLLFGSFGDGSGFGVYQLVEDVLRGFGRKEVVPHLKRNLASPLRGIRYWNAEIAASFPDASLVPEIVTLLGEKDEDIRSAALIALGQIKTRAAKEAIREALEKEPIDELRAMMRRHLERMADV